jgi:hypothetical protein
MARRWGAWWAWLVIPRTEAALRSVIAAETTAPGVETLLGGDAGRTGGGPMGEPTTPVAEALEDGEVDHG